MSAVFIDFEKPLREIEEEIHKLERSPEAPNREKELSKLKRKAEKLRDEIFSNLTPWQRTQLARHPDRPYTLDFIEKMCTGFIEIHGDRCFGDDKAIVGGITHLGDFKVVIVGHQKGRTTKQRTYRNFGMPHPEGYRKAMRIMRLGEKFKKPIISFLDTPGAYPGIGAEERGQSEAIARNIRDMFDLKVPIIVVITGEGGSGGALGIGVGDRVLMLENAIYSVISPEGCAAILWRDSAKAPDAAAALKITAHDLLDLGIIDEIIPEPSGGAHRNHDDAARLVKDAICKNLEKLLEIPTDILLEKRFEKFRNMGVFTEEQHF
ncbi:acetyl-CoA carboxylase carboxyltransferase subunit alpha [bacterium]|nr:acetyl-CoA carboxylase carboxyltransferase subunit alpha [bacterium]